MKKKIGILFIFFVMVMGMFMVPKVKAESFTLEDETARLCQEYFDHTDETAITKVVIGQNDVVAAELTAKGNGTYSDSSPLAMNFEVNNFIFSCDKPIEIFVATKSHDPQKGYWENYVIDALVDDEDVYGPGADEHGWKDTDAGEVNYSFLYARFSGIKLKNNGKTNSIIRIAMVHNSGPKVDGIRLQINIKIKKSETNAAFTVGRNY